jgi:hypothetical protein
MTRVLLTSAIVAFALLAQSAAEKRSITGWVVDSACAFTKKLTKPVSPQCAVACARKGSPLVILEEGGTIYWPIAESMPAEGQNSRLLSYAGQRVTATGKVYERSGSRAIVIENIAGSK